MTVIFKNTFPSKARVLLVHNSYQQIGGEDTVFRNEADLLEAGGYVVERFSVSNNSIDTPGSRALTALGATYNFNGRRAISARIQDFRPDIVHVHNFFPQLSPAIFDACIEARVASVWTLHNFRVVCANGLLFRNGTVCEDCVGIMPIPAIRHRCYRNSTVGTAAVAAMIGYHSIAGTWRHKVDRFIALNAFARDLFIRSGLPAERVAIKPNFSQPSSTNPLDRSARQGAVYVGRLSKEKGANVLIDAWRELDVPLTVFGDGPDRASLEAAAPSNVVFSGFASSETVSAAMTNAQALIVPSVWYENYPMTVVEAMAAGTPVITSRLGALQHIVEDDVSGLHFSAGDAADLARVVRKAFDSKVLLDKLGAGAYLQWQSVMSPDANLSQLEIIYQDAIIAATRNAAS